MTANTTQRVAVESLQNRLRKNTETFKLTSILGRDCWEAAETIAALLQQLAEERELRMAVEQSWHHELARAEAAERAREGAIALLDEVAAQETVEPEPDSLVARIDAFLAANGGSNG